MDIILLNGPGSSGKSSIARAIQHLSDKFWFKIGIDNFIDMMPASYLAFGDKAEQGIRFLPNEESGNPIIGIHNGKYGDKIISLMPKFAKIVADSGMDLIIDEVIFSDDEIKEYIEQLKGNNLYIIGVNCSLEIMEEREILRGDRCLGLARDQYNKVHNGFRPYNLIIDTSDKSSFYCAKEILALIK